uniref:Uncharacterized protein n=1 Tax=Plectus sambesii TaxID=2011161 RepID=A0A914VW52_9BILA
MGTDRNRHCCVRPAAMRDDGATMSHVAIDRRTSLQRSLVPPFEAMPPDRAGSVRRSSQQERPVARCARRSTAHDRRRLGAHNRQEATDRSAIPHDCSCSGAYRQGRSARRPTCTVRLIKHCGCYERIPPRTNRPRSGVAEAVGVARQGS